MKILVMGTGAVGGCFGGMLKYAGYDVVFYARGENFRAIQSSGLHVESVAAGKFSITPPVVKNIENIEPVDLILYCVKSYHNEDAVDDMADVVSDQTAILTLQNGLGSGDILSERFGSEKVILGAAYIEAVRKAPGIFAELGGDCSIVFGEQNGSESERLIKIRDALQNAKIGVEISKDIQTSLWTKLVKICGFSGMACMTRVSFAEVLDTPETNKFTRMVMQEVVEVGRMMGADLADDLVESSMAMLEEHKQELSSSMYLDLKEGNPLEVSVLNGAVSNYGRKTGIQTPINDFISGCLAAADRVARASYATRHSGH